MTDNSGVDGAARLHHVRNRGTEKYSLQYHPATFFDLKTFCSYIRKHEKSYFAYSSNQVGNLHDIGGYKLRMSVDVMV